MKKLGKVWGELRVVSYELPCLVEAKRYEMSCALRQVASEFIELLRVKVVSNRTLILRLRLVQVKQIVADDYG